MSVSTPSTTATAGSAQSFTVTSLNPSGGIDTQYAGTVQITSSDLQATLPAKYTFTAADAGVHTFTVTLRTAGVQSIFATDIATPSITGTESKITVASGVDSFTVAGFPTTDTAGTAGNVTVTVHDQFGNIATGYTGTVQLTSSDPQATLPASYAFTAADAGVHTFTVTLMTAGVQSIIATDTLKPSINGTESNITVTSAVDSITVAGFPTTDAAGTAGNVTVTIHDQFGNVATGYTGTVQITSSDPKATLPASYTFTSIDAGSHIFNVTLMTTGVQSIIATDTLNPAVTGTESNITVKSAATSFTVAGFPGFETAGTAGQFTVTAYDQLGNVAAGYTGTVQFTSSDPKASLPASYTFVASDAGSHIFSATLKTTGNQYVKATDTASPAITGTESNITVKPASAASLTVSGFPTPRLRALQVISPSPPMTNMVTSPQATPARSGSPAAIPRPCCRALIRSSRQTRGSTPSPPRSRRRAPSRSPRPTRSPQLLPGRRVSR